MHLAKREMMTDLTQSEKHLATAYGRAEVEAANKTVRDTFRRMEGEIQASHARLFHELHQRGWYQTPTAGQQAIESTIISWEQKLLKEPELSLKD